MSTDSLHSNIPTEMDIDSINKILEFWFRTNFPPPEDAPFRSYWFRSTFKEDQQMKATFSSLYDTVSSDLEMRKRWETTHPGKMALIILLDQLPRNMFRGTAKMFATDYLVIPMVLKMAEDMSDLTPIEKVFVYTAIQHSENLEHAKMAEEGLKDLVKSLGGKPYQKKYSKLLSSAKSHVSMLEKFGRYCHRNELLGRPSTEEEKLFLMSASNNFICSVNAREPVTPEETIPSTLSTPPQPSNIVPMRVLLLHGFRQNATVIRSALKPLISKMKPHSIEFIVLNSPMVYRPGTTPFGDSEVTHPTWSQPAEHLRCWWNATDDGKEYIGWEASVRFIERAWIEKGGWDGVVAFSQGATLVSLLLAMPQMSCSRIRFAVLIAGSPSRAIVHQQFFEKKISGVKTLNIYGKQDHHLGTPEQMKERTLKLAACFEEAEVYEHGGGHFTPKWWPWDVIVDFILNQALSIDTPPNEIFTLEDGLSLEERLDKYLSYVKAYGIDGARLPSLVYSQRAKDLFAEDNFSFTDGWAEPDTSSNGIDEQYLDDLMFLSFIHHPRYCNLPKKLASSPQFILKYVGFLNTEYLIRRLPLIVKYGDWKDLNQLVLNTGGEAKVHTIVARQIHEAVIEFMGKQLKKDAVIIASQTADLSGEEGQGTDFTNLSLLAKTVPRIRGQLDNFTHFARDLALWIRPAKDEKDKLTSYVGYQKLYRSICTVLEKSDPDRANYNKGREMEEMPRLTLEERKRILAMPPNVFVKTPEEVPVAPCSMEDLEPLIKHLRSNPPVPNQSVKFVRGTIIPVQTSTGSKGILDLCKQVVGPEGVTPLLDGLFMCKGVEGLLLGNNVTGSKGAREIAKYIRRKNSQITTWYLGGNQFGPDDIGLISKALETDSKVLALWLKRNPVLPEGTLHLAKMLAVNRTIITLDLSNCGLLDEGCICLFKAGMKHNRTMKHLYLNTNGITPKGANAIADFFHAGGTLESLYISCNPLGDEGVEIIAKALKGSSLVRLGLSSCAIGDVSIKALVDSFATMSKLEYLNLGFLKGTYLFNGLPNYFGLNGIKLFCEVLPKMPSLRYLDICHNQIPPEGLQLLVDTLNKLPEGTGLTTILHSQFGQQRSEFVDEELKAITERNTMQWGKKVVGGDNEIEWMFVGDQLAQRAFCPDHVREIMSTTRNMD